MLLAFRSSRVFTPAVIFSSKAKIPNDTAPDVYPRSGFGLDEFKPHS
jgi:hypothetical protein